MIMSNGRPSWANVQLRGSLMARHGGMRAEMAGLLRSVTAAMKLLSNHSKCWPLTESSARRHDGGESMLFLLEHLGGVIRSSLTMCVCADSR